MLVLGQCGFSLQNESKRHACLLRAQVTYLGLEHVDTGPRQRHHNSRGYSQYERPVKIYN